MLGSSLIRNELVLGNDTVMKKSLLLLKTEAQFLHEAGDPQEIFGGMTVKPTWWM